MSANSKIQWTDKTWNCVIGCTRVSAGCEHCYAEQFANRLEMMGRPEYAGLTRKHADGSVNWTGVVKTLPDRLEEPLRWKKPAKVFVNSMSDLFHEAVPDEFIAEVFAIMARCPQHTFQVLTKRPERMRQFCAREAHWWGNIADIVRRADYGKPLPNVWLGVSVENQAAADERIPLLLQTPAAVRFISAEPLLGPVDLVRAVNQLDWLDPASLKPGGIDWCIVGAESGPNARPMDVDWVRRIRDDCVRSEAAFFLKQFAVNGRHIPTPELDGRRWLQFPDGHGGIVVPAC